MVAPVFDVTCDFRETIAHLFSIFPVMPKDAKMTYITNIGLPNTGDYRSFPSDLISAALGNVVHLVILMAKYLDIGLPYFMQFNSSHSLLWREGEKRLVGLYV